MSLALVTGATGFIGANVLRILLEKGLRVRVLARLESDLRNLDGLDAELVRGDLRDAESLERAVRGCDEVYHVAADYRFWAKDTGELYASNLTGTQNILSACRNQQTAKLVYTSTVGTIGLVGEPTPCTETTPMDPHQVTSHYKRSKWEAEKLVLEAAAEGLPVVIVNPSAPIGPWDRKPTPTGKMIVDMVNGRIPAYVDTGLNFVHVRDVAEGHWLAARFGKVGERYILGNQNLELVDFFRMVSKVTGRRAPTRKIPYGVAWAAGAASTWVADHVTHRPPAIPLESVGMARRHMFFDPSKAVRELGLPQSPVEEAVEDAVAWFKNEGYLV
jgi:dihydroflavonol-4-reductase